VAADVAADQLRDGLVAREPGLLGEPVPAKDEQLLQRTGLGERALHEHLPDGQRDDEVVAAPGHLAHPQRFPRGQQVLAGDPAALPDQCRGQLGGLGDGGVVDAKLRSPANHGRHHACGRQVQQPADVTSGNQVQRAALRPRSHHQPLGKGRGDRGRVAVGGPQRHRLQGSA